MYHFLASLYGHIPWVHRENTWTSQPLFWQKLSFPVSCFLYVSTHVGKRASDIFENGHLKIGYGRWPIRFVSIGHSAQLRNFPFIFRRGAAAARSTHDFPKGNTADNAKQAIYLCLPFSPPFFFPWNQPPFFPPSATPSISPPPPSLLEIADTESQRKGPTLFALLSWQVADFL